MFKEIRTSIEPNVRYPKIFSPLMREEVDKVLHNVHPSHTQRLWLVGFLNACDYSLNEILHIISFENKWEDYDKDYCAYQIKFCVASLNGNKGAKIPSAPAKNIITPEQLINEFVSHCTLVPKMRVPRDPEQAAYFYYAQGMTPVPKSKEGRFPALKSWKKYALNRPTTDDMIGNDWSNGTCLIANNDWSYLDVDVEGYNSWFTGFHCEHTPSGGLHVFGKGKAPGIAVSGVGEIKGNDNGKASLIVAYPSPGYVI